ncbi:hypothetical protein SUGI_0469090 [Cryptomeria japonica]|uniref:ankyrin repeat-containing protein At5g02620-like n=1 Tax=Cryptomeria japonica TaxID=3369 RepID=UPI002408C62E|nr:ankyrin repeat-containing protein At5g02620-like [Cryptomeria japonica]GLJ24547.1 hypothetical protein SUGI_0469090 [Cryptomeria japonica]
MDGRLYAAVTSSGDVEALRKLIDGGHEIHPQEKRGTVPLRTAPYNGPLDVLHQLTPGKNTPLHLAARKGHLQIVKRLLELMNDDIESGNQESNQFLVAQNLQGDTALHEAAKGGHFQVVNVLLEKSIDLANIVNKVGETALFKAAEEGHDEIVVKLVHLTSSDYDRRTSDGRTPVHAAVFNMHTGVIHNLLEQRPELLMQADSFGMTPLHSAAYVEKGSEIAKLLLEKNNSLCYVVDMNEQSALHIAVIEGNVELVKEILTHGQDCLEIVDKEGRNAIHLAAENAVTIFEKNSRRMKDFMLSIMSEDIINNLDIHGKTSLDIVLEKMGNDEHLFSATKGLLEKHGARSTPKMANNETLERSLSSNDSQKAQMISVSAVLIATVAFDASLDLPGKDKQTLTFVAFVLFDALAFCSAIATTIILIYAVYDKHQDSLLLRSSIKGLWIALISLALAFGATFLISVESNHSFVRGIVWLMALSVPLIVRDLIYRSKQHIFKDDVTYTTLSYVIGGVVSTASFTLFDSWLLINIFLTLAFVSTFVWTLVTIIKSPRKSSTVKTIDDSILDRVSNSVWGRIAGLLILLAIVVTNWAEYFRVL